MLKEKNRKKVFLFLVILMTLIIWTNSILPADLSSTQSGFFTSIMHSFLSILGISLDINQVSFIVRKSAHFGQFFLLGIFWFQYLYQVIKNKKFMHYYVAFFCLLTAIIDESIQLFSIGRAFQFTDILIDFFGSIIAIITCKIFLKLKKNQGESK
jgi:VanZ family protein